MIFYLCDKAVVTNINLGMVILSQLLSLSFLFLKVHESVKNDSKNEIHYEKVANNYDWETVNDSESLVIYIHHVIHHLAPAVSRDELVYHDKCTSYVIECRYTIENLGIVFQIFIFNVQRIVVGIGTKLPDIVIAFMLALPVGSAGSHIIFN
jgi:hypothetical protein